MIWEQICATVEIALMTLIALAIGLAIVIVQP